MKENPNIKVISRHLLEDKHLKDVAQEPYFLIIHKPIGWTSFQLVQKIRRLTKVKKVGHAGTLDPLAEGLMLIAVGKGATQKIDTYIKQDKSYIAEIKLGETTASYDLESEPVFKSQTHHLTPQQIETVLKHFLGEQEQTPPIFSAIKKDGERAYDLARAGKEVTLAARKIFIKDIQVLNINIPFVKFEVSCTSGTYIRSLADDIGKQLGCGAYLHHLVRTKIGDFDLKDAVIL